MLTMRFKSQIGLMQSVWRTAVLVCQNFQVEDANLQSAGRALLIFDEKPLRREAYIRLLAPWAAKQDLDVLGYELFNPTSIDANAVLAVISVGHRSVSELQYEMESLQNGASFPPILIISDLGDASEIATALRWGARGFIPTTTPPDLAMSTMTFVLSGGEFFPVSTLQKPNG